MTEQVKKVILVTNSSSYEPRAELVGDFFEQCGCRVLWVESDFIHREKQKKARQQEKHVYLDTFPYQKNLSVRRLYSHWDFAKKAEAFLKEQQADLLYVLVPANALTPAAVKAARALSAKLVIDVIDLWPESLGMRKLKHVWPFSVWTSLRDKWLNCADVVLTECAMYQQQLPVKQEKTAVMYWPKEQQAEAYDFHGEADCLHFVYLGSINNIIDIGGIIKLLAAVKKWTRPVLHMIGDGERRKTLLQCLQESQIETVYHGAIYDEKEKKNIFARCSYGINMMKPGVCVGLTMKSIDYFCYGIPLVNNIPGDTWELVEEYGIGINVKSGQEEMAARQIADCAKQLQEKRSQIQEIYEKNFTKAAMNRVLRERVLPLLKEEKLQEET